MIKFANEKECINQLVAAMKSGDEKAQQKAWEALHNSIAEQIKADFTDIQESHDAAVLAQRGYRQLTSKETKWYQKVIAALKSNDPKQAFTAIIGSDNEDDLMPTTIIEDVYKNLQEEHPLLKAINFQYVGYITKWILNDHSAQNAVWGQITESIITIPAVTGNIVITATSIEGVWEAVEVTNMGSNSVTWYSDDGATTLEKTARAHSHTAVFDTETEVKIALVLNSTQYSTFYVGMNTADSQQIGYYAEPFGISGYPQAGTTYERTFTVKAGYALMVGGWNASTTIESLTVLKKG